MDSLSESGVEPIRCDLLDRRAVADLPDAGNVIFMAGRKFGTSGGGESLTWAMNTIVPANVAERFPKSRIVAFSTGCVYPLVSAASGGSVEEDAPSPVGEYAQSCLGRERIFGHFSGLNGTPVCLLRLNYAVEPRYGVVHDTASRLLSGEPISLGVAHANVIWQGDANIQALLALEYCGSPARPLNITGPETISIRRLAEDLGREMGVRATFSGEPGPVAYLNNSAKATALFGYPSVPLGKIVEWTADWVMKGMTSLGKPTHFEVSDGKF
jgi:nucleoside-diphosphate-sugar epimerase